MVISLSASCEWVVEIFNINGYATQHFSSKKSVWNIHLVIRSSLPLTPPRRRYWDKKVRSYNYLCCGKSKIYPEHWTIFWLVVLKDILSKWLAVVTVRILRSRMLDICLYKYVFFLSDYRIWRGPLVFYTRVLNIEN